MLGSHLVSYLTAKGYEVIAMSRSDLDLLGTEEAIKTAVLKHEPQLIIHSAAMTNVDAAEQDPELAMAINKDGTRKLVLAAKEAGAIMAYISTDYVFDGLKDAPYTIDDRPNPVNTYGLSKYYGELQVTELMEMFYIIRVSLVYGIQRNNYMQFVLDSALSNKPIKAATDIISCASWTGGLCATIENIIKSGAFGVYHACDSGSLSRYDRAMSICQLAGLPTSGIEAVTSDDLPLKANRPRYTTLDCSPLAIPDWETSFYGYLEEYKQKTGVTL